MQVSTDGQVLLSPSDLSTWATCEWAFLRRLDAKLGRGGTLPRRARRHARAHRAPGGPARARLPRHPQADPRRRRVRPPPAPPDYATAAQQARNAFQTGADVLYQPTFHEPPTPDRPASSASPTSSSATTRAPTRSTTPSSPATPRSAPCSSSPPTPSRCRRTASPPASRSTSSLATGRRPRTTSPTSPRCTARSAPNSSGSSPSACRSTRNCSGATPVLQLRPLHDLPDPGAAAPRPGPRRRHAPRPAHEADPGRGYGRSTTWRTAPRPCPHVAIHARSWCVRRASRPRPRPSSKQAEPTRPSRLRTPRPPRPRRDPGARPGRVLSFFDFEGDPLHTEDGVHWGLDYLFGWSMTAPTSPPSGRTRSATSDRR